MAKDNNQIAADVLAAVGGADNVVSATHCMTRLRLNLKDESIPNEEAVKNIPGVLGAQWSGGQFQVIIGQNVPKVYAEAIKMGVKGAGSVDENLDAPKGKLTPAGVGKAIMNYLSKSMVAIIPIILVAALFRTLGSLLGPDMLGVISADGDIYNFLYNWMYDAGFYFLPLYLGYTAANAIGVTPVLGMMIGGMLIAPELIEYVNASADTGVTSVAIYGIFPASVANYSSTVLPILLSIAVMKPVEQFFKKVIPDMLSTLFVPFCTVAVMAPISLCLLAPLGNFLGNYIGSALFAFGNMGGIFTILAFVILGACWEFLVMTGMHVILVTLAITELAVNGSDTCVMIAGSIAQWAAWGIALGAFLKLKDKSEKGEQLGFFLAGMLGGVTEPSLYGCGFKYTRTLIAMMIGGGLGALIAGICGTTLTVFAGSNCLNLLGYVGGTQLGFIGGVVGSVVALISSAAIVYFFGFTEEQLEEDRAAAEKAKRAGGADGAAPVAA